MPGRVSARSARSSTATLRSKQSTTSLKSRASSTRASALAVEIPDEGESTQLRDHICAVFGEAQKSTATQRKLVVRLRKIQELCCYEAQDDGKKGKKGRKQNEAVHIDADNYDEDNFNTEVARCVLRVLAVKKSESAGDKVVRFLGLFLKFATEKDNAIFAGEDVEQTMSFPETPSSHLTSHILSTLLPLLTAKDKTVRFRSTQIIAHIVNTLDSIDDELFQLVRLGLLKRIRDKESTVRVQAVLGLGRLADEGANDDDGDDSDDEGGGILLKLLDILQNDPSAEVRRSLLLNLPFTPSTLPFLLERARDLDGATRRVLYSRLLPALGDFRHLSLTHREKLLRWGLRDRDETVRRATARLFRERWIEDCVVSRQPTQVDEEGNEIEAPPPAPGTVNPPDIDALLELLERIDVINSGVETGIGLTAMQEFWDGRPDYMDYITFPDEYWDQLSPEAAFVARTFNEYCRSPPSTASIDGGKLSSMAEEKMPEVTKLAFLLQGHVNRLMDNIQAIALAMQQGEGNDTMAAEAEEDTVSQEFCVEQMLHIALTLDYTDEIGRRKMFSVCREALALSDLPDECTRLVVDVLRMISGDTLAGEKEFIGVVLEAIAEVHDTIMGEEVDKFKASGSNGTEEGDESFHSARSELSDKSGDTAVLEEVDEEKAIREIVVNLKCLHIASSMLQNISSQLESDTSLVTMLNNLVVPAVRSQEAPVRREGLKCLGLCCLLSKNLAEENITLFLHCWKQGHEELQILAVSIVADMLTTWPSLLAPVMKSIEDTTNAGSPTKMDVDDDQTVTQALTAEQTLVPSPLLKPLLKLFHRAITSESAPTLTTTAATALSKLMLLNTIKDNNLLTAMTVVYFNPTSSANPALRQVLAYFLPVYCHSRAANSERMAHCAIAIVNKLITIVEEDFDEEDEGTKDTVGLANVAAQLADWTDPRKLAGFGEDLALGGSKKDDDVPDAHLLLAEEVLGKIGGAGCLKEEKKTLLSLLSKLYITPPTSGSTSKTTQQQLKNVHELVTDVIESRIAAEASARNTLTKFQTTVAKHIAALSSVEEQTPDQGGSDTALSPPKATSSRQSSERMEEEVVEPPSTIAEEADDAADAAPIEVGDETTMTHFAPEAEGTVIGNGEDEDETVLADTGKARRAKGDSIVESLLESEDDL